MAPKGSFDNKFADYSSQAAAHFIGPDNALNEKFMSKLLKYRDIKLTFLTTQMASHIFNDPSVYTGSAGLALYYITTALKKNANSAESIAAALPYIIIENLKGRRISFLCGDAGPLALATIVSYKLGDNRPGSVPDYKTLSLRLMALSSLLNDSPDELLYGRVGYLYALLFVNKTLGEALIPANHIEKVVTFIITSGRQLSTRLKSPCPLMWEWHDKVYFGAAHGAAGILYLLLQATDHYNVMSLRNYIKATLDWLLDQQFPDGNYPSSYHSISGNRLVQWCHGAPGFVPLCLLAYNVFKEDKYLQNALKCGEVVWQRGLSTKGYSLCHGVAGNAYSFIQLYQATHEPVHLYRACCFMDWCMVEQDGTEMHRPDRPASLFEGLLGRIQLAEDLADVANAQFPAYTL